MVRQVRTAVFMAALMVAASVSAVALRPTEKIADRGPRVDLEAMIPKKFGDWRIDERIVPLLPAPDVQAKLDKIYNQTLARTYVNAKGQRIMLSIAYGGDQSDAMQVHLPEVCYAAQGFQVRKGSEDVVNIVDKPVAVRRLVASLNSRVEPITYWITVGNAVVNSGLKRKFAQLSYGLGGSVPDGFLVRASSIGKDGDPYGVHDAFLRAMIESMDPGARVRLIGKSGGGAA